MGANDTIYMYILMILCFVRTILSLVYTALKLCIDIDPTLFDECANEYKHQRQMERKLLKEREDNWKQLQQKVERLNINKLSPAKDISTTENLFHSTTDPLLDDEEEEEEEEDTLEADSPVEQEQKDNIHPDMQQFDSQPTQYQFFRRKSIIPVDETVSFIYLYYY